MADDLFQNSSHNDVEKEKSSFAKKALVGIVLFFVLVKLLSATKFGQSIVEAIVNISNFFFDILLGKIDIQEMSGEFSMKDIVEKFK